MKKADTRFFIGIDPAIGNTGVVILNSLGNNIGLLNTDNVAGRKDRPYYEFHRLEAITNSIIGFIRNKTNPVPSEIRICLENYSYNSDNKAFVIGELGGVLRLSLVKNFGHLQLVEPTVVKKFATGSGGAGKTEMIRHARIEDDIIAAIPEAKLTSDICDAFHLAKFCWYRYAGTDVLQHEKHRRLLRLRMELAIKADETADRGEKYVRKRKRAGKG